jgi:hypothetical protein
MVQPLLMPRLITASGAVFDFRRAERRTGAVRPRGVAAPRGVAPPRGVAERDRAVVALPRADPARARLVVELRDLPAMDSG